MAVHDGKMFVSAQIYWAGATRSGNPVYVTTDGDRFHATTGLPCPTCGMTPTFALAVHGHLTEAFVNQPAPTWSAIAGVSRRRSPSQAALPRRVKSSRSSASMKSGYWLT